MRWVAAALAAALDGGRDRGLVVESASAVASGLREQERLSGGAGLVETLDDDLAFLTEPADGGVNLTEVRRRLDRAVLLEQQLFTNGDEVPEKEIACEPLTPNLLQLRTAQQKGPVFASAPLTPNRSDYVFVIATPESGSTALFSVLASSPNVATLCKAGLGWNCEGWFLLKRAGLLTKETRNLPDVPKDWSDAVKVYEKQWDMTKPVLVEKSPNNLFKTAHIAADLVKAGKQVNFIVLTRSPCFAKYGDKFWLRHAQLLHTAMNTPGVRTLHVRYEDLVQDPYALSAEILSFLPSLGQLDPSTNNLADLGAHLYHDHKTLASIKSTEEFGQRRKSVVEYILEKETITPKITSVPRRFANFMADFGYATNS